MQLSDPHCIAFPKGSSNRKGTDLCLHPPMNWDEGGRQTMRITYLVCWSSHLTQGYNTVSSLMEGSSYWVVTGCIQEYTL